MRTIDLNITAKKMEAIVSILTSWINEKIDEYKCESKLSKIGLDEEQIEWFMDHAGCSTGDLENHILNAIEEYFKWYEIEYGNISNECGHDIYLSQF